VILRFLAAGLALWLCGCSPGGPEAREKAFLGALLLDGSGGPPLSDSVVIVSGGAILAAGPRSSIPVPDGADRIDGSGKVLVPAPVDVSGHAVAADPEPDTAGNPVIARATTQARAVFLVDHGATGLIGMIADTDSLDPALVARLRDLKITVAPALLHSGPGLDVAKRNTLRMFRAGVALAVASEGGDLYREMELMEEAGVPPLDVLVAATRNGAAMLREADRGTIAAGKRADLLLLLANPGAAIDNLRQVVLRLDAGNWVRSANGR
jgi:imidazolonepropionase-like amidohydrolase